MIPLEKRLGIFIMIPSSTETKHGILVLADISGYTRFSRLHFTSLLHAEQIITELMESILGAVEFPLQVGQLEGDAVLFFVEVPTGSESEAALEVTKQVRQFFHAFNLRERSLIACDAGCACQACNQIGELKLKAAIHSGNFSRREFRGVVEYVGEDVTLLHALLKAPMPEREHILLTQSFYELSGSLVNEPFHETRELTVDDKTIPVHVYFPRFDLKTITSPKGAGPAFSARLNQHAFGRMLFRTPRAKFNNLSNDGINLLLYLLEGLNSAINIIRKNLQRALRHSTADVVVRPSILLVLELKAASDLTQTVVSDLLESVLQASRPPLVLNKLDGNTALMYVLAENDNNLLAENIIIQARRMFKAFIEKRNQMIQAEPKRTPVLNSFRFRVILHAGDVAYKKIKDFDELGGLSAILIYRLLQQSGAAESSLWMTESFYKLAQLSESNATILTTGELDNINVSIVPLIS
jgi:class 3 adenylate cyclase